MKRIASICLILCLLVSVVMPANIQSASAESTIIHSGTSGSLEWSIDSEGVFRLSGSGDYDYEIINNIVQPPIWCSYSDEIKKAIVNVKNISSLRYLFCGCSNLADLDISKLDTSKVTDMGSMFSGCSSLTQIDVSGLDTSKVTDMSWMFSGCSSLTQIDVSKFDTSKVTYMGCMFYECKSLIQIDVSNLDTSKVTDMDGMFFRCSSLTQIDVSKFDTSKVTNMASMFYECSSLSKVDVSGFDTSKVTNMASMFDECSSLSKVDVSGFDTSKVIYMGGMFFRCSSLTQIDVSGFDTSKVMHMGGMFSGCSSLTQIDISKFDTSKVTGMNSMFDECSSLTQIDVRGFDTSKVTDMAFMFYGCSSLRGLDIKKFDTTQVTDMSCMFYECSSLGQIDVRGFDTSKVTDMRGMFSGCSSLAQIDVRGFDTSKVTDMDGMFSGCSSLTQIDVSGLDTSKVTNMGHMFEGCSSLREIDVSGFDTSKVTDMSYMFTGCSSLIKIKSPYNLKMEIELPSVEDTVWKDDTGKEYDTIPAGILKSLTLLRYDLTDNSSTEYYTSTEGVCSKNQIANLLGKEEFRNYTSCIGAGGINMIIPGIKQTNVGDNSVCKEMVAQGLCVTNKYILISAYCSEKRHRSVIYVMDANTKKYITTIILSVDGDAGLKTGNHVGGLAYGNRTVFIAGSSDNKIWKMPIDEVDKAVTWGKDCYKVTIPAKNFISTTKASYVYWDDCYKQLFVGHFDEYKKNTDQNYMISYNDNVDTGLASSGKIQLPLQTQGVSFGVGSDNKTYCICSKSYGQKNQSEMYVAELKKIKNKNDFQLVNWHKISSFNMSEDIQIWNGKLYNCFESAANKYNNGAGARVSSAMDRITILNTQALISTVMKKGTYAKKSEIAGYALTLDETDSDENNEIILEGSCGEDVNYCLYGNGSMVISGQGAMDDYLGDDVPWNEKKDEITSVYIDNGVERIGNYAFYNCNKLEQVIISEYMNSGVEFEIGEHTFENCMKINRFDMPDIFFNIEDTAFDKNSKMCIYSDSDSIKTYCENHNGISLHQHHLKYLDTVQPTCMEMGYDSYVCDCGYEEIENVTESTNEHTFVEVERVEATLEEDGYIKYQCSSCMDTYYETLENELSEISVSKKNTIYEVGDKIDIEDLKVTAIYSSGIKRNLSNTEYTTNVTQLNTSEAGTVTLMVSYTEKEVTKIANIIITIKLKTDLTPSQPTTSESATVSNQTPEQSSLTTPPNTDILQHSLPNTVTADTVKKKVDKVTKIKVSSVGKKRVFVKWKKDKNVYIYKVQISKKKNFKKSKSKMLFGTKYTFKNLKQKKTYYIRVRACVLDADGHERQWSPWSSVKKVKVK